MKIADGNRERDCGQNACTIRPQVSGRSLLILLVVLAALLAVQTWYSVAALAVVSLTWLYGCPRTRAATKQVAAAIYLPVAAMWLVASQRSGLWSSIGIWPGLIDWPASAQQSRWIGYQSIACLVTVGVFLAAVTAIRFHPATRAWILLLLAALSSVKSFWLVYQWFSAS